MKPNLILIGMPASGKSTLGQLLAAQLGLRFLDTDDVLISHLGEPLQTVLNREGLPRFLQAEERSVLTIEAEGTVIATGGSVVYSQKAMAHLKAQGFCIYLSVPYRLIEARLHNMESRGVAIGKGKTLLELFRQRDPLYAGYADLIFREDDRFGDKSCAAHTQMLTQMLPSRLELAPLFQDE